MNDSFCERPWGTWLVLAMQPGYKVKKLTINPGQSMSKQYHTHRDEYWVVLQGNGEVTVDASMVDPHFEPWVHELEKGYHLHIPKQVIHKCINTGTEPLIIIETQVGEITEEGDIVRLD